MRRGKEVIGKKIVTLTGEVHAQHVRDLIFDVEGRQLLALLTDEGGWFHSAQVLPYDRVHSIGEDAVIISDPDAVVSARDIPGLSEVLSDNHKLIGTVLTTTEGDDLGSLADLYFEEESGRVTGYDVSGGIFSDLSGGRSFVPVSNEFRLGKDVVLVPPDVADQMEEQAPGGLKGVANNVSESVKSAAKSVGNTIQETAGNLADATKERQRAFVTGKTVSSDVATAEGKVLIHSGEVVTAQHAEEAERLGLLGSLTAAAGGGAIQGLYSSAKDSVQEGYENISTATKERQQAFVVGKTAGSDVTAEDGTAIVRKGDVITAQQASAAESHGALGSLVASAGAGSIQKGAENLQGQVAAPTVDDALGRRVKTDVRGAAGTLVAPAGQIVTQAVIDRAKTLGKEQELLAAVQIGTPTTQRLGRQRGQLGAGLQNAQETSANLLDRAKNWLSQTQEHAAEVVEERQIEQAVGRPSNRVVLDKQDNIILNIGEIITHKAVEQARQADVLGILLGSVSTAAPTIDPMSVRPDEHGRAALESQPDFEKPDSEKARAEQRTVEHPKAEQPSAEQPTLQKPEPEKPVSS